MSVIGFVFWTLLGLYITYIVPTEFGTRKHPCFCFMWKKRRRNNGPEAQSLLIQANSSLDESEIDKAGNFERVGNDLKELEDTNQCLKIDNLSKVYPNGFKAVNNLSLTMYSGQIFALLGHNGAGKTTTISMLTGLFGSSGGRAEAFGVDLLEDQESARKIMGV
jgi:ATP-binding cassette subfamily A (ABC1) protein 3